MDDFPSNENNNYTRYQDEYNKNAKPGDPVLYPITFTLEQVARLAKFSKFVAIMTIISGGLNCLSSNIIVGVLMILSGIRLLSVAETFSMAASGVNSYREELLGEDLLGYFKYYCISVIISLAVTVFAYFVMFASMLAM